jgi:pimeloyl-ACP methyl ester carboxylesterase
VPLLQVGDIELYYESHGTGDPLVLIGGLGLAVSETQPLIKALAAGYRVIAADNRGAGRSAKPPGPYTIEQMAADIVGLLARLGVPRAHVLGISMGGRIAMTLATRSHATRSRRSSWPAGGSTAPPGSVRSARPRWSCTAAPAASPPSRSPVRCTRPFPAPGSRSLTAAI